MEQQAGALTITQATELIPVQAETDARLIAMWLHGRSAGTARAYAADVRAFLAHAGKLLRAATVGDVQAYGDSLAGLATASQARKLSAVKSLLTYAHRLGYVTFNVGAAVKLPPIKATLAERIMGEADVHRMLALETDPRNAAMLRLLYCAGLRISEVCGLAWRDMQAREDAGQATVYGKGGKTRVVLLPAGVWRALVQFRGNAGPDAPVFVSQRRGHSRPVRRPSRGEGCRKARGAAGRSLGALAAARPCLALPRSRRTDPLGASHARSRQRCHHWSVSACATQRQLGTVSSSLSSSPLHISHIRLMWDVNYGCSVYDAGRGCSS